MPDRAIVFCLFCLVQLAILICEGSEGACTEKQSAHMPCVYVTVHV